MTYLPPTSGLGHRLNARRAIRGPILTPLAWAFLVGSVPWAFLALAIVFSAK